MYFIPKNLLNQVSKVYNSKVGHADKFVELVLRLYICKGLTLLG